MSDGTEENRLLVVRPPRSSVRTVLSTAAVNMLTAGGGALGGILAARLLGPTGRGELAAIITIPTWLASMAVVGLPDALVYFAARHRFQARADLVTAVAISAGVGLLIAGVGWLVLPIALSAQRAETIEAARLYLLIIPIFVLGGLPFHVFRGLGRFGIWNALRLTTPIGWVIALVACRALNVADPSKLAIVLLCVTAASGFAAWWKIFVTIPGPMRPTLPAARRLLNYGLPTAMASLPQAANLRADQVAMAAFLQPRDLGLYVSAVAWSGAASPALTALGTVLFPRLAAEPSEGRQTELLAEAVRTTVAGAAFTSAIVAALSPIALPLLFGEAFRAAVPAAVISSGAMGILAVTGVLEDGLLGLGLPRGVLRAELVGLGVTGLGLVFLLTLGPVGAAIASCAGYAASAISAARRACRETELTAGNLLMPRPSDLTRLIRRLRGVLTRSA